MQETNTELVQWVLLALVQGLTEYLPVSSSAHLILLSKAMDWEDQGLIMDIAAHGGSLIAVMWYFKTEIAKLFQGNNWSLFNKLALASIPLAIAGYLLADFIEINLRSPTVIATSSIVFGLLLYWADTISKAQKREAQKTQKIGLSQAAIIGLSQVFALIPGASRSGVTMSAAMALGFSRTTAAKFSFLLAIPALLMTTGYGFLKVLKQPEDYNILGALIVLVVSFISSLFSIKIFLKLIEKISISVFVWYRILLAIVILWLIE
ncbi:MAG: undecaprenyl-diphosphate phosphatase [Proteobacteria bacterium]|nr:undecaprenyl-diphosphate phosphatase [Pseudomonadota bacterium]